MNYLETEVPYMKVNKKDGYIISLWHKFKPENLKILQDIQREEMPHLEIETSRNRLRLKRQLPDEVFQE